MDDRRTVRVKSKRYNLLFDHTLPFDAARAEQEAKAIFLFLVRNVQVETLRALFARLRALSRQERVLFGVPEEEPAAKAGERTHSGDV